MASKIWVYVDQFKGKALPAAWEALGVARALAGEAGVAALIFGAGVEALAAEALSYGADEVLLADDSTLAEFRPEPVGALLAKLAAEHRPEVILVPASTRGRDLSAIAAVDLGTGVLADVIKIEAADGALKVTRPVYAGKLLSTVTCSSRPQIISLRSRAFAPPQPQAGRSGTVTRVSPALAESEIATRVVDYAVSEGQVSLGDAGIIVSGGRGVSNPPAGAFNPPPDLSDEKQKEIWRAQQGFRLVGDLASTLGAAVGASRAAVDAGYVPYANQVGQTGKTVSPDLYLACGISGAIQHQAGMRNSKAIVAVNKDAEAPIFKLARYGIAGDLFVYLPAITAEFKKRLGK
ncbi:MAG: electron transfer flavoprotein subunit alpha/FixB family protein [Chloroflexi bacterium]|nr:electron transfer flavoprotein subunit alpha/FixB family protein [Chloroflexota bacterium]